MEWLWICAVLSLLCSSVEFARAKGQDCPQDGSRPAPTAPSGPAPTAPGSQFSLDITKLRELSKSPLIGGNGGELFEDDLAGNKVVRISSMKIWHGDQVNGIEIDLADGGTFTATHHESGGEEATITLGSDDVIVRIEVYTNGDLVDRISFVVKNMATEENTTYGPYGKTGENSIF